MMSPPGEAYVDSLFDLEPPGRGKRLGEEELVTLCSEVMSAGTDTSATALEWVMMHLILDPAAQERVYDEVVAKAGKTARITEADVEALPYLQVMNPSIPILAYSTLFIFDIINSSDRSINLANCLLHAQ